MFSLMKTKPNLPIIAGAILVPVAAFLACECRAQAQAAAAPDPYKKSAGPGAAPTSEVNGCQISLQFETFSMSVPSAAALLRTPGDDEQKYQAVLKLVQDGKASEDLITVTRVQSGQRMVTESIDEYVYGTEFQPPDYPPIPNFGRGDGQVTEKQEKAVEEALLAGAAGQVANSQRILPLACPVAFQTRNTGETIELDPDIQPDARTIRVSLVPQFVRLTGEHDEGCGIKQPNFQTRKITTTVLMESGKRFLLGTINYPLASGVTQPDPAHLVCLEFVTPAIIDGAGSVCSREQVRAALGQNPRP